MTWDASHPLRKRNGSFFNLADLQTQEECRTIRATYHDVTIYDSTPTQGVTVLQMLKMLEPLELHNMQSRADHVHLMVQAKSCLLRSRPLAR